MFWPSKYQNYGAVFLYFDRFYSLMLADDNVIYLSFVIIYDWFSEIYCPTFARKIAHITLIKPYPANTESD